MNKRVTLPMLALPLILGGCQSDLSKPTGYSISSVLSTEVKTPLAANARPTSTHIVKDKHKPSIYVGRDNARVSADFNNDGIKDWFSASLNDGETKPGTFSFLIGNESGKYSKIDLLEDGCIFPQKLIVNDYNNDGYLDIAVACTGIDLEPFPGEPSKIVMSDDRGGYKVLTAIPSNGYRHGGAAADFNGDGNVDLIFANFKGKYPIELWLGDGAGRFEQAKDFRLPKVTRDVPWYFVIETPDLNRDGRFDLIIGGPDGNPAMSGKIFINSSEVGFIPSNPVAIPKWQAFEGMLDIDTADLNGQQKVFILRSGNGWKGFAIQEISFNTMRSRKLFSTSVYNPLPWIKVWTEDGNTFIGSDDRGERRLKPIKLD